MLTHFTRQIRAGSARFIVLLSTSLLCSFGTPARADTEIGPVEIQITSVRISTAAVTAVDRSAADASAMLDRLTRLGATVTRSAFVPIQNHVASMLDGLSPAGLGAEFGLMTIVMPHFNPDGSVTLNLSVAESDTSSSRQLSAVRTFAEDGLALAGVTEPQSTPAAHRPTARTFVFVALRRLHAASAPPVPGGVSRSPGA